MKITAVCICKNEEIIDVSIPFYCHTEGYRPILHRNNSDWERIEYLTRRYTDAVNIALEKYSDTEHILIIDSYYLHQPPIHNLIRRYQSLHDSILGASIWINNQTHILSRITYYDTLSVREFEGKRWRTISSLPSGLKRVGAVGACWIFPRRLWKGKFEIIPGCLVNSPCIQNNGCEVMLDCDVKLWRAYNDGSGIVRYPMLKRMRVSAGEWRRKIL